jgi:nitrogen PTS system EIIA component
MTLAEVLSLDRVFARVRAADKARLLQELARQAGAALGLPPTEIGAALAAREALGSTGVGKGIAVPHAAVPGLTSSAAFLARLDRPIDYAAIDGAPVDLVFLLLGPPQARAEHLALLAAATRRLRDAATAESLRTASNAEQMRALMLAETT